MYFESRHFLSQPVFIQAGTTAIHQPVFTGIYQSATRLKSLTGGATDIDHLVKIQYSAGKLWFFAKHWETTSTMGTG